MTEREAALLRMLVRLARDAYHGGRCRTRVRPGDLVVEITKFDIDPDAIGWLVARGHAPYEREPALHVGDCPMINTDPASRTRCVCEHHDTPRDYLEGGGGRRGAPTREVWDLEPLSGRTSEGGGPVRWENADFVALPDAIAELARAGLSQRREAPAAPCHAVRERVPCELAAGHDGEHRAGDKRWR